ncbi:PqqD family peptide modification chaperone [Parvimonas parva]|uniref:PqqD family peptide modification chaperone n=1 Tax=Parvimonas parva TaxID=2769485 RepID=A0ABS1CAB8_9FIRM|nr:PqqD family peptide modification chaperone [Parvimonas parva]MBK1469047.1 PqqD family peptide modification chaperone [Parvimonas parva]
MNMNLSLYKRSEGIKIRKISDNIYIIKGESVFEINYTGIVILKYIGKDVTVYELAKKIFDEYKSGMESNIAEDIFLFLNILLEKNIIEKV